MYLIIFVGLAVHIKDLFLSLHLMFSIDMEIYFKVSKLPTILVAPVDNIVHLAPLPIHRTVRLS